MIRSVHEESDFLLEGCCSGLEGSPAVLLESHFRVEVIRSVHEGSDSLLEGRCSGDEGSAHQL